MKIFSMTRDVNGRSTTTFVDIQLNKVSETESLSAKQDGVLWRIGFREPTPRSRSNKDFSSLGGPQEMHVGGPPHFVGLMAGHFESTMQDGGVVRLAPGEFHFVHPGCLHHSNYYSNVMCAMFNLLLPGTEDDTGDYPFK